MNVLRRPAAVFPHGAQAVLDNEGSYNVVRVNDIFKDLEGGTVSIRPDNQHDDVTLWAAPGFHWETSSKWSVWNESAPAHPVLVRSARCIANHDSLGGVPGFRKSFKPALPEGPFWVQ